MLVFKARKNPKFVNELFSKGDLKDRKRDLVEKVVTDMDNKNSFIDSSRTVIKQI